MAHFAELGIDNVVLRVIVVNNAELLNENGVEEEERGIAFCRNLLGGTWIQTSYNNSFRKRFAGKGYTYSSTDDVFIPPKPFNSWTLNNDFEWEPPTPRPETGFYRWNESSQSWELQEGGAQI